MTAALEIKQLRKTYANGVEALRGIDLTVEQGDFFGLLGPNGAGKSTLIGILSSLVNASAGEVTICGYDLHRQRAEAMASIGLVPQEINFNPFELPLQIVVNQAGYYGVPRGIATERAERLLKQLDLWDKHDKPSRTLSGGMKRRLMIARALVNEPRLLILDEPTAGVDIEIRRSMWSFLSDINQRDTTVILTTHYLEEAEQLCRNIAIIDHGQLIENTDVKSLIKRLDIETFVFDLEQPVTELPELDQALEANLRDPHTLEVALPRGNNLNQVFTALQRQGITVTSMRNKANRLEELFLRLLNHKKEGATQ
ncbi:MAG: ABC transporter ATP-binding protein [Wenzhouxiangellaceae bacterium]